MKRQRQHPAEGVPLPKEHVFFAFPFDACEGLGVLLELLSFHCPLLLNSLLRREKGARVSKMDCQTLLEKQARDQGLSLTCLAQMNRYSRSQKIPCCGGVVVRVETESSADSTVCLRDDSGVCYCALHGELTNRYPDVLSTGALLCFANITLLVTSAKMPPLLVACLENLVGLMLPDEDATEATRLGSASDGPWQSPAATAGGAVTAGTNPEDGGAGAVAVGESLDVFFPQESTAAPPLSSSSLQGGPPVNPPPPPQKRAREELRAPPLKAAPKAAPVKAEVVSDDDEGCLELVDDL